MAACWKCKAQRRIESHLDHYFCSECGVIVPIAPDVDHFSALGFCAPDCSAETARERGLDLNRRLHPDRFMTAPENERRASTINVSAVNDAQRCLVDVAARARYWLEMRDLPLGKDNNRVDPALAAELFELQEAIVELRGGAGREVAESLMAARDDLEARQTEFLDEAAALMAAWPKDDDAAALKKLRESISTAAYLGTVLRDVKLALEESWQESVA